MRDPIAHDALLHTRDALQGRQARVGDRTVSLWIKVLVDRVKRRASCEQPVEFTGDNYRILANIHYLTCGLSNFMRCVKTCLECRLRVGNTEQVVVHNEASHSA